MGTVQPGVSAHFVLLPPQSSLAEGVQASNLSAHAKGQGVLAEGIRSAAGQGMEHGTLQQLNGNHFRTTTTTTKSSSSSSNTTTTTDNRLRLVCTQVCV